MSLFWWAASTKSFSAILFCCSVLVHWYSFQSVSFRPNVCKWFCNAPRQMESHIPVFGKGHRVECPDCCRKLPSCRDLLQSGQASWGEARPSEEWWHLTEARREESGTWLTGDSWWTPQWFRSSSVAFGSLPLQMWWRKFKAGEMARRKWSGVHCASSEWMTGNAGPAAINKS